MKIVKKSPSKNWKLRVKVDHLGYEVITTGTYPSYSYLPNTPLREIDNCIVEASLRVTSLNRGYGAMAYFLTNESGTEWSTSSAGALAIFRAVQEGILVLNNAGYFEGYWTFGKHGSEVFILPYDMKNNQVIK